MHLLLLPGMDGTGRLFEPLVRALPASLKAAVVSYPVDRPCGYEALLPYVEAAVPKGGEFIVLGESFSGPLAVLLAAANPPRLRGLILCASFVRSPLPGVFRWLRGLVWPLWFRLSPMPVVRRMLLGQHHATPLGQTVEAVVASVAPAVLAARARAVMAVDVGRQLRSCPVPVLYLAAKEDRLVRPRSLDQIRRMCPELQVVTLPGPHLILQVAAVEAAGAIRAFAARCELPAKGSCREGADG